MKILYILPYDWGGSAHYTAEIANAVSNHDEVVVIGCKSINSSYFTSKIKIIRLFGVWTFSMNQLYKVFSPTNFLTLFSFNKINIIKKLKPDVIHLTRPIIPPLAIFLSLYRLDKKYPLIYTKHGVYSNSGLRIKILEETILGLSEKLVSFQTIIVHTQNDKDELLKAQKYPEEIITVIPHGAYSFFKNYGGKVQGQNNCILFFGNIRKYKGLEYLIKAVPLVSKEIPDIKIVIAGEGSLDAYNELLDEVGRQRFEIHNEFIPDEQVSELFQRATIVVLPYSEMSGQSGIINIAFAFGKPIVASDVGGIHEVLNDGEAGYLVPPKNPEALARAIIRILSNEKLRVQMGEKAAQKALKELSWDNIATKHIEVYKKAIEGFAERRR
jgi:glycosyltransferase involved in cell wall biosynthesis